MALLFKAQLYPPDSIGSKSYEDIGVANIPLLFVLRAIGYEQLDNEDGNINYSDGQNVIRLDINNLSLTYNNNSFNYLLQAPGSIFRDVYWSGEELWIDTGTISTFFRILNKSVYYDTDTKSIIIDDK